RNSLSPICRKPPHFSSLRFFHSLVLSQTQTLRIFNFLNCRHPRRLWPLNLAGGEVESPQFLVTDRDHFHNLLITFVGIEEVLMAGLMSGDPLTHHGAYEGGSFRASQERPDDSGGRWYFSRKEIEENSPSRQDGIDLKKETYLRKSYCTFLQDLGMRLKV
uniref:Uncharacterized protein n=1 Tax=Nicotiana tabacum TaxID=4097 RepID=A0A1S4CNU8_TOBAC